MPPNTMPPNTMPPNYDGKTFRPVVNEAHGQVTEATVFRYAQTSNLLTAEYSGGGIRSGQMLGLVDCHGGLEFCYHHVTDASELRSGTCTSTPEYLPDGRIRLHERWRWTFGDCSAGTSVVEEAPGAQEKGPGGG